MVTDVSFLTCIALFQPILKVNISSILSQDFLKGLQYGGQPLDPDAMSGNYGVYIQYIIILLFWWVCPFSPLSVGSPESLYNPETVSLGGDAKSAKYGVRSFLKLTHSYSSFKINFITPLYVKVKIVLFLNMGNGHCVAYR